LNLERLQSLQAVATFGSVTSAASALRLTPSAVSQHLGKLQRDVGQRLVEPYGRGVRLTPAGTLLAEQARLILAAVEGAESALDRQRDRVVGDLQVAAFATAARAIAAPAAARLIRDHPQLTVRLSERQPDESVPLVAAGHLDLAVVNDWSNAPIVLPDGLTQRLVLNDPVDLAVPPDHPLAVRDRVHLTELGEEGWITWPHGGVCHEWLTQTLRRHGLAPEVRHTAGEHPTQLAMVAAGLGVAVVPRLGRGPADGVRLIPLEPSFTRQIYVVWREIATERPATAATVAALQQAARAVAGPADLP
jgi:DNA-binding transcriptional LysR family regulator